MFISIVVKMTINLFIILIFIPALELHFHDQLFDAQFEVCIGIMYLNLK